MKNNIVLGVTGSIAAYKAADLCSRLVQSENKVTVIMTESAAKLVTPQTFFTLSKNRVVTSLWEIPEWRPEHIALAEKSDILAVVPATANFIGKYANGIADDALTTYALSHTGKVIVAPAMNPRMWSHPAVQHNIAVLKERGVIIAGPGEGRVACGDDGKGRLEDISLIYKIIMSE